MPRVPPVWTVRLPPGVREPYTVFLNGVRQQPGRDFTASPGEIHFHRPLQQEGRLGFWRWFMGAWGIGTYRKDDQVDVSWEVDGRPLLAHNLPIVAPPAVPDEADPAG